VKEALDMTEKEEEQINQRFVTSPEVLSFPGFPSEKA